jgi:hypothetical protein
MIHVCHGTILKLGLFRQIYLNSIVCLLLLISIQLQSKMPSPNDRSSRNQPSSSTRRSSSQRETGRPSSLSTQQRARPPGYEPSPDRRNRYRPQRGPTTNNNEAIHRQAHDNAAAEARTARRAANQNLARERVTTSRKNQRPWTLKEFEFVSTIRSNASNQEMKTALFKFQDKFNWTPSEGQLRSQHWYFKMSNSKMRDFLKMYAKYEQGRNAIKEPKENFEDRLRKNKTVVPRL